MRWAVLLGVLGCGIALRADDAVVVLPRATPGRSLLVEQTMTMRFVDDEGDVNAQTWKRRFNETVIAVGEDGRPLRVKRRYHEHVQVVTLGRTTEAMPHVLHGNAVEMFLTKGRIDVVPDSIVPATDFWQRAWEEQQRQARDRASAGSGSGSGSGSPAGSGSDKPRVFGAGSGPAAGSGSSREVEPPAPQPARPVDKSDAATELIDDPWAGLVPKTPIAVGEGWDLDPAVMVHALGIAPGDLKSASGRGELVGIVEWKKTRAAHIQLRMQGDLYDRPRDLQLTLALSGPMYVDLERHEIMELQISGTVVMQRNLRRPDQARKHEGTVTYSDVRRYDAEPKPTDPPK